MKKIKILITGAGGYIGSIGAYLFLQKGYDVVAVDNFTTGYKEPLSLLEKKFGKKRVHIYEKNIQNGIDEIIQKEHNISAVIHYAASSYVNESFNSPQKYFTNNVTSTYELLQSILKSDIKYFIFSSTCAVYKDSNKTLITENSPFEPNSPYAESKLIIEKTIEWYAKTLGIKYVILRYFNVTGAADSGILGDSKKPSEALIQNAVRAALGIDQFNLTYKEVPTKDGSPIRDFIDVVDVNLAHCKTLEYLENGGKSDCFNIGSGKGHSVLEIINVVKQITKRNFICKKSKIRKGESKTMIADNKKAGKILHWKPSRSLEDSIQSLVLWYKNHPQGWQI